jgi:HNH endonuclease
LSPWKKYAATKNRYDMDQKARTRLMSSFKIEEGKCWPWLGRRTRLDYGEFFMNYKNFPAHRAVLFALRGVPLDSKLVADHLCRNPCCVNPDHLEMVSRAENTMRGMGACAKHARKTHCKRGHEYNQENTYINGNKRYCKTCRRPPTFTAINSN